MLRGCNQAERLPCFNAPTTNLLTLGPQNQKAPIAGGQTFDRSLFFLKKIRVITAINIQTYRGLEVWGLKEPEEELVHKLKILNYKQRR